MPSPYDLFESTREAVDAFMGLDIGKPGGDHTAVAVRCDCGRLGALTWPAEVDCRPIAFHCPCGKVIPLNATAVQPAGDE